jgi:hypothetical protein
MERSHAELQQYHYGAVRQNPAYRAAGLADCEAELIALNTPPPVDLSEIEGRIDNLEALIAEPGSIPRRYHDLLQQTRFEMVNLKTKVIETRPKKPKVPPRSTYKGLSSES